MIEGEADYIHLLLEGKKSWMQNNSIKGLILLRDYNWLEVREEKNKEHQLRK